MIFDTGDNKSVNPTYYKHGEKVTWDD